MKVLVFLTTILACIVLTFDYIELPTSKKENADARLVKKLARLNSVRKQNTTKKQPTNRIDRAVEGLYSDLEDYRNELMIFLIGLVGGGILIALVVMNRGDQKMKPHQTSLSANPKTSQKTSATAVDLKYQKAQEAAVAWSTTRTDKKEQQRLRKLLAERTETSHTLKKAIEQEAEVTETANRVYLARGEYDKLPPLEQADVECKMAEKEATFNKWKVETAEAQRKIREGEAFKRAILWQQRAHRDHNILDPHYREHFAKTSHTRILSELREKWNKEWEEVMQDTELVAHLYKSSPEVLDWLDAYQEIIRLAERFAMPPNEGDKS